MVKCGVFFAVRTEFLNNIETSFHVALRESCADLPILTSKFRPKVPPHPHVNNKISPNAALPRLISKFKISIECSKTLRIFSPSSTYHLSTFSTSERLTFSLTYLYQKDERALPGNLHCCKYMFPPLNVVSVTTLHFIFSLSSIHSLIRLQRVNTYVCFLRNLSWNTRLPSAKRRNRKCFSQLPC
jgi:hypothetical protein